MKDTRLFEQILEISLPWYVKEVNLNKESKELRVEISYRETIWACPECRRPMHIHEYNDRRWRHLDSCQFKTIITAKIPRVQCPTHGTQVVKVPWAEERSRFTLLFERLAIDVLLECSVSGACDLLGISWDEASGIKQRAVKRGMSRKEAKVCAHIGVDEKRAGRGQNYVTVVADTTQEKATVEFVGDGHTHESLDAFYQGLNDVQLKGIMSVSMDMWDAYKNSTISNVPGGAEKIVYDRYHISQCMNNAVNQVRKWEHATLQSKGDDALKGTRQMWLFGKENLPEKHFQGFEALRGKNLKTARAWAIKEQLRDFWDCSSVKEAREFFNDWYNWAIRSKLEPIKKTARMMKKRLPNILTYFKYFVTNAALEGLNNKIQSIIQKAYGYRNKERFKMDILFHCGGLNLYPGLPQ